MNEKRGRDGDIKGKDGERQIDLAGHGQRLAEGQLRSTDLKAEDSGGFRWAYCGEMGVGQIPGSRALQPGRGCQPGKGPSHGKEGHVQQRQACQLEPDPAMTVGAGTLPLLAISRRPEPRQPRVMEQRNAGDIF